MPSRNPTTSVQRPGWPPLAWRDERARRRAGTPQGCRRHGAECHGWHGATHELEILREAQLAAGDYVLLDLRRAAADGVEHGVAVRRVSAPLHRGVLGVHPQHGTGAGDV